MKNDAQKVIDAFMNLDAKIYISYQAADKTDMFGKGMSECIELCEKYMSQIPAFMEASRKRGAGMPTELRGANRLATIYEKRKEYAKALKVCEIALSYGCGYDGTKTGVAGRADRLRKKIAT